LYLDYDTFLFLFECLDRGRFATSSTQLVTFKIAERKLKCISSTNCAFSFISLMICVFFFFFISLLLMRTSVMTFVVYFKYLLREVPYAQAHHFSISTHILHTSHSWNSVIFCYTFVHNYFWNLQFKATECRHVSAHPYTSFALTQQNEIKNYSSSSERIANLWNKNLVHKILFSTILCFWFRY